MYSVVSVPCSSSSTVVTVICGHCSSLLSVNLMKISFLPFSLLTSLSHDHEQQELLSPDEVDADQEGLETQNSFIVISSDNDEDIDKINPVNRPRRKDKEHHRLITASSKKRFEGSNLKIQTWLTKKPSVQLQKIGPIAPMSTARMMERASAWKMRTAHGPLMPAEVNIERKGFHERKVPRDYMWAKTPFE
uniref:YABBY N-terminal domain-containing protein n=1 Tax=Salix viminalis TaxID=40686 RepID=A0A6N2NI75_SALVM